MNYVILNGVKSTTIKGLLIQSLPPISKPLMRTSVEEIDGRDGDIVTNLGFKAYDKQMSIGLFGDYDVDEVIKYFDSQGTVIFSNEPDKFYKYQIIAQIDFEKLIRFKTATVTFHVQPFKYSAVDEAFSYVFNKLNVKDYTETKNGVSLSVGDGQISLSGTASAPIEFYVPIESVTLGAGNYTLNAISDGTGESACSIRIVGSVATDDDSFGGTYLALESGTASLDAELSAQKTFNFLWIYVTSGTALNFTLNTELFNDDVNSFSIFNRGNTLAKPKLTIYGSGIINLSINGVETFVINLGNARYITIDSAQMNAYQGNILMNRSVVGDYSQLVLNVGTNVISWTGNVEKIEIENFVRWI